MKIQMTTEIKINKIPVGKKKIPIDSMVSHTKELICGIEQRSFMLEEQITSVYLTI